MIILNISRLNTSVERQRFFWHDYKLKPNYILFSRHKLKYKNKNSLKIKEWKQLYSVNSSQRKAGKSLLTSDKIDLKANLKKEKKKKGKKKNYWRLRITD